MSDPHHAVAAPPEGNYKMQYYYMFDKDVRMDDLFDGRLEQHGVREEVVEPKDGVTGTNATHRYLVGGDRGWMCVHASDGVHAFELYSGTSVDCCRIIDAIRLVHGAEPVLDDGDFDPNGPYLTAQQGPRADEIAREIAREYASRFGPNNDIEEIWNAFEAHYDRRLDRIVEVGDLARRLLAGEEVDLERLASDGDIASIMSATLPAPGREVLEHERAAALAEQREREARWEREREEVEREGPAFRARLRAQGLAGCQPTAAERELKKAG